MAEPPKLKFSVASKLFRELGERLVGNPETALAELVKNSYDADAFHVEIKLERPNKDFSGRIVVKDSGHGMTKEEFAAYWMRVGEDRKARLEKSPYLKRTFTGSKGVGRISAMFLGHKIKIETIGTSVPNEKLTAWLDWRQAVEEGDLQQVAVEYKLSSAGSEEYPGTTVTIEELKQDWDLETVKRLAHLLWRLEPPYLKHKKPEKVSPADIPPLPGTTRAKKGPDSRQAQDFIILFDSPYKEALTEFEDIRNKVLSLFAATIRGEIKNGKPTIGIEFRGESPKTMRPPNLAASGKALVQDASFEILVFDFHGRQKGGIKVSEARNYLWEFGGVQIFDERFRLPHYGTRENDWLLITLDHARRLAASPLVPKELQVAEGMHYMPTYYQVFGRVDVHTQREPNLEISITRDRLVETPAFFALRQVVRASLHWYGMLRTARLREDITRKPVRPVRAVQDAAKLLRSYSTKIPEPIYKDLKRAVERTTKTFRQSEDLMARQLAALSGYATAGIAALAYQHELSHQLTELDVIASELGTWSTRKSSGEAAALKSRLTDWTGRVRELRGLFSHLLERENMEKVQRFRLGPIIDQVRTSMSRPLKGVTIVEDVDAELRLPPATLVEWMSITQNVVFNAINALQDRPHPRVRFRSEKQGRWRRLYIEDNGSGLKLARQDEFFKPFVRGIDISPESREHGYGGTGLGLAIVKMLAERRECRVRFVKPPRDFATTFCLEWEETT